MESYDRLMAWGVRKSKTWRAKGEETLKMKGLDADELGVKSLFWFGLMFLVFIPFILWLESPASTIAFGVWIALMFAVTYVYSVKPYSKKG